MFIDKRNVRVHSNPGVKSLTQQSDKDASDIRLIVKRGLATGQYPVSVREPVYGNGLYPDFLTAQRHIAYATQQFEALPSRVRESFHNDVSTFMQAVSDPANYSALKEMGISVAHLPEPPMPVIPSPAAQASTPATPVAGTEPKPAGA